MIEVVQAAVGARVRRSVRRLALTALLLGCSGSVVSCGLLDVSDPTLIEDKELDNAAGAELLRAAALRSLSMAVRDGAQWSGLMADEFMFDLPPWGVLGTDFLEIELIDRRDGAAIVAEGSRLYGGLDVGYGVWHELRRTSSVALAKARIYALDPRAKAGEMLAWRGYATVRLAEDVCSGFPLHEVSEYAVTHTPPLSTTAVLERALADFDSAVVLGVDSARILNLSKIGRARALLDLGRFAEAGSALAGVPTGYLQNAEYLEGSSVDNGALVFGPYGWSAYSVTNREGASGLDFVSANDPRVQLEFMWTSADGVTPTYRMLKYPNFSSPIALASGIEARLIEAEAALNGTGDWLGILNALRTTCLSAATCPDPAPAGSGGVGGLPPLSDPGTREARIDLLFRERAFWLFATGHRLGDLRRLVDVYGRSADDVFPAGAYRWGGAFGASTGIPFPANREVQFSPSVTGCTKP